jgi:hypothetical protein
MDSFQALKSLSLKGKQTAAFQFLYWSLKKPSVLHNKNFISIVFYYLKVIRKVSEESINK